MKKLPFRMFAVPKNGRTREQLLMLTGKSQQDIIILEAPVGLVSREHKGSIELVPLPQGVLMDWLSHTTDLNIDFDIIVQDPNEEGFVRAEIEIVPHASLEPLAAGMLSEQVMKIIGSIPRQTPSRALGFDDYYPQPVRHFPRNT
jgi:hypothetical protein